MRDLILVLMVLGLVPTMYMRPFVGLLVFSWLAYMRPQDLCWGFARTLRLSFLVALVMFVGFFTRETKKFYVRDPRCTMMIWLAILALISIPFGKLGFTARITTYYVEFVKIIMVAMFTTTMLDTKQNLRIFSLVVACSLGFYGFKTGVFGILTGGGTKVLRGPGGMLKDNNDFALAMVMNIPFVFYLGLSEKDARVRKLFMALVPLTMITVVLTHSRGGFLAMVATVSLIVWRTKRRWLGFGMGAVVAVLFVFLMPESYKERLSTIGEYKTESSAQSRIESWGVALRMISDSPVIGVGFRQFQSAYFDYLPEELRQSDTSYVAHNSYLQIWAETGSISFFIYMLMLASVFWTLGRLRRRATRMYGTSWVIDYARMYEASLLGFMVGSTFLNRGHFDLVYHIVAAVIAFKVLAERQMRGELLDEGEKDLSVRFFARGGFGRRGLSLRMGRLSTAAPKPVTPSRLAPAARKRFSTKRAPVPKKSSPFDRERELTEGFREERKKAPSWPSQKKQPARRF